MARLITELGPLASRYIEVKTCEGKSEANAAEAYNIWGGRDGGSNRVRGIRQRCGQRSDTSGYGHPYCRLAHRDRGGAQSIAVTSNGKTVYVPNGVLNTVTPIRTATNTARPPIAVGGEPFALVVTPNGRTVYVGNTASASVTPIRVSTNSPLADIPVSNAPI